MCEYCTSAQTVHEKNRKKNFPCNLFGGKSCSLGIGQYV